LKKPVDKPLIKVRKREEGKKLPDSPKTPKILLQKPKKFVILYVLFRFVGTEGG